MTKNAGRFADDLAMGTVIQICDGKKNAGRFADLSLFFSFLLGNQKSACVRVREACWRYESYMWPLIALPILNLLHVRKLVEVSIDRWASCVSLYVGIFECPMFGQC